MTKTDTSAEITSKLLSAVGTCFQKMNFTDILNISQGLVNHKMPQKDVYDSIMIQFKELHRRRFKTIIKDQKLFRVVHSKLVRDLLDLGMENDKVFKQMTSEAFTKKFYKNAPNQTDYEATYMSST
jgi:hypothetical protein